MAQTEILTIEQLRQCVFENRTNKVTLEGIIDYFRENQNYYNLRETFEINAMVLGALELYHDNK